MNRNPTAVLTTLRAPAANLLPRVTLMVYGREGANWARTLTSIKRERSLNAEVILLHDHPEAANSPQLDRKTWPASLPVRLLQTERPAGKAHSVNLALDAAQGEHLLVLEAGDLLQPDALLRLLQRLQAAPPSTAGVYGTLHLGQKVVRGTSEPNASALRARLAKQRVLAPPLVRKRTALAVGGYPTDYPGEGWLLADTAFTLALLGEGTLQYAPIPLLKRPSPPLDRFRRQDERSILNVLLRRSRKS